MRPSPRIRTSNGTLPNRCTASASNRERHWRRLSTYQQLLDIEGGSGAYCIEAARKFPNLRGAVCDLAPALEIASEKITAANLSDRIETRSENFFEDDLPQGFDVHLLSMVLHDWTPEKNLSILRKNFQALRAGGTLIVSELMMDDDKSGPVPAALMSLNMLIETEGRNYTWTEYTEWVKQAGFENIQRVPIFSPGANGLRKQGLRAGHLSELA